MIRPILLVRRLRIRLSRCLKMSPPLQRRLMNRLPNRLLRLRKLNRLLRLPSQLPRLPSQLPRLPSQLPPSQQRVICSLNSNRKPN